MHSRKSTSSKLPFFLLLAWCSMVTPCMGQENIGALNEGKLILSDSVSGSQLAPVKNQAPVYFPNFKNQISDVVRTVFQDSKGVIWFGTQNGAFCYNGTKLHLIDSIRCERGRNVTIKDIAEDRDGRIWFGHTGGVSVLDGNTVTNYYERDGLVSNDVWCLETNKNNRVWIGTLAGVCVFDGSQFRAFELPEGQLDTTVGVSSTRMIHDILEDSRGRMWLCTNGGIFIKDQDSLTHISENDGLNTNFINQVLESKSGDFWISTSKGLFQLKGDTLINTTELFFQESKGAGSIAEDSEGAIWFNCSRSIYRLDGEELKEFRIVEGNYGPLPFHIYQDRQNRLWFVGYGGAFRYEHGAFINITKDGPF